MFWENAVSDSKNETPILKAWCKIMCVHRNPQACQNLTKILRISLKFVIIKVLQASCSGEILNLWSSQGLLSEVLMKTCQKFNIFFIFATLHHRRNQKGPRGPCPVKFLAYLVILCFEKRHPKQKYCCSLKVKHFAPHKFLGWLRHCTSLRKTAPTWFLGGNANWICRAVNILCCGYT